jgi:hypothetical protein
VEKTLNPCFEPYRNRYAGQTAILFGTGGTLKHYMPFDGMIQERIIRVGVNGFVYNPSILLDYYFIGDPNGANKAMIDAGDLDGYRPMIQKFIRARCDHCVGIPDGHDGVYYQVIGRIPQKDITKGMGATTSIVIECLQFLLFAGAKTIYLIGVDARSNNDPERYISNLDSHPGNAEKHVSAWLSISKWVRKAYSGVEVKVVNPLGLLGIFTVGYIEEIIA